MEYYEIYPGGEITGEIVIETEKKPDINGNVCMTEQEFDNSFTKNGTRKMRGAANYHTGYDVTHDDKTWILHTLPYDHPSIQNFFIDNKSKGSKP